MSGDFIGMGITGVYLRLIGDLADGAFRAARTAADNYRVFRRRHAASCAAEAADPLVLADVEEILKAAVDSGRLRTSTARKYLNVLAHFLAWLGSDSIRYVFPATIEHFLADRAGRGIGLGALRVDLSAIRTVLDKLAGLSATCGLQYPVPPPPVVGGDSEQAAALLAAADDDQDRLLVLLLNVMKLRPGQIVQLQARDILFKQGQLMVRSANGTNYRLLQMPPEVAAALKNVRRGTDPQEWLFESSRFPGRAITVRAVQKRLVRIGERCGVLLSCTELRRTASLLGEAEIDERPVEPEIPPYPLPRHCLHPAWIEFTLSVFPELGKRGPPIAL